MGVDILIKEADGLSEDKIAEVVSFIQFLKTKDNPSVTTEKRQFRTPGGLKGDCIMAEDFDDTPECFKEYV